MKKLFILSILFGFISAPVLTMHHAVMIRLDDGTSISRSQIHPILRAMYDLKKKGDIWSFYAILVHTKKLQNYYQEYDFESIKPLMKKYGFLKLRPVVQDGIYIGLEEYISPEVEKAVASAIIFETRNTCKQETSSGEKTSEEELIDEEQPGAPIMKKASDDKDRSC